MKNLKSITFSFLIIALSFGTAVQAEQMKEKT